MSTDDDFTAYAGTHWSALVRTALLLGCPTEDAEAAVQAALVRSYPRWARLWSDDRVDEVVLGHLLDDVYAPVGRSWRGEAPATTVSPDDRLDDRPDDRLDDRPDDRPDDEPEPTTELALVLDRLSPLHRDVLVLRHVAELGEDRIATVLGVETATVRARLADALAAVDPARLHEDAP